MLPNTGVQRWALGSAEGAPPAVATDDALLRRLQAGDATALEALSQLHGAALFGYLLAITSDRSLAEEVLQDTLLVVWRSASGFRGSASVRTWLFAIARRQARDRSRRRRLPIAGDKERAAAVDPAPGPEQRAMQRADLADLVQAIKELPLLQREVLALIFVHQLTYEEAAQVLAVPLGTVKSRLSLARRALHRRYQHGKEN
ncbi:MAG TPA: sigma-70 family RNA polymerase sigma factor [Chloroflexota bacterium]|jgi:RNA polymerase sigma-70 factor (ECF subfamily)|nr:sigma-70 family RNA polymerase sigma factor [Chloroflexota bacterium]